MTGAAVGTDQINARQAAVDANLEHFLRELPTLQKSHPGKIALLREQKVVEFFDTIPDAVTAANRIYPDGLFSIQRISHSPIDLGFFSHANN